MGCYARLNILQVATDGNLCKRTVVYENDVYRDPAYMYTCIFIFSAVFVRSHVGNAQLVQLSPVQNVKVLFQNT